jgi:hypothetical protein
MGRQGSLDIDGVTLIEGESLGILEMLNTEGNIYIGALCSGLLWVPWIYVFLFITHLLYCFVLCRWFAQYPENDQWANVKRFCGLHSRRLLT